MRKIVTLTIETPSGNKRDVEFEGTPTDKAIKVAASMIDEDAKAQKANDDFTKRVSGAVNRRLDPATKTAVAKGNEVQGAREGIRPKPDPYKYDLSAQLQLDRPDNTIAKRVGDAVKAKLDSNTQKYLAKTPQMPDAIEAEAIRKAFIAELDKRGKAKPFGTAKDLQSIGSELPARIGRGMAVGSDMILEGLHKAMPNELGPFTQGEYSDNPNTAKMRDQMGQVGNIGSFANPIFAAAQGVSFLASALGILTEYGPAKGADMLGKGIIDSVNFLDPKKDPMDKALAMVNAGFVVLALKHGANSVIEKRLTNSIAKANGLDPALVKSMFQKAKADGLKGKELKADVHASAMAQGLGEITVPLKDRPPVANSIKPVGATSTKPVETPKPVVTVNQVKPVGATSTRPVAATPKPIIPTVSAGPKPILSPVEAPIPRNAVPTVEPLTVPPVETPAPVITEFSGRIEFLQNKLKQLTAFAAMTKGSERAGYQKAAQAVAREIKQLKFAESQAANVSKPEPAPTGPTLVDMAMAPKDPVPPAPTTLPAPTIIDAAMAAREPVPPAPAPEPVVPPTVPPVEVPPAEIPTPKPGVKPIIETPKAEIPKTEAQKAAMPKPERKPNPDRVGTSNAKTNEIRQELGVDPHEKVDGQSIESWVDESRKNNLRDKAETILDEAIAAERPLSHIETAGVLDHLASMRRKFMETLDSVNSSESEIQAAHKALVELTDKIKKVGTNWGRAGVARQLERITSTDKTVLAERFYNRNDKRLPTKEELDDLEVRHAEYRKREAEYQAKLKESEARNDELARQLAEKQIELYKKGATKENVDTYERVQNRRQKYTKEGRAETKARGSAEKEAAKANIKEKLKASILKGSKRINGQASAGIDPKSLIKAAGIDPEVLHSIAPDVRDYMKAIVKEKLGIEGAKVTLADVTAEIRDFFVKEVGVDMTPNQIHRMVSRLDGPPAPVPDEIQVHINKLSSLARISARIQEVLDGNYKVPEGKTLDGDIKEARAQLNDLLKEHGLDRGKGATRERRLVLELDRALRLVEEGPKPKAAPKPLTPEELRVKGQIKAAKDAARAKWGNNVPKAERDRIAALQKTLDTINEGKRKERVPPRPDTAAEAELRAKVEAARKAKAEVVKAQKKLDDAMRLELVSEKPVTAKPNTEKAKPTPEEIDKAKAAKVNQQMAFQGLKGEPTPRKMGPLETEARAKLKAANDAYKKSLEDQNRAQAIVDRMNKQGPPKPPREVGPLEAKAAAQRAEAAKAVAKARQDAALQEKIDTLKRHLAEGTEPVTKPRPAVTGEQARARAEANDLAARIKAEAKTRQLRRVLNEGDLEAAKNAIASKLRKEPSAELEAARLARDAAKGELLNWINSKRELTPSEKVHRQIRSGILTTLGIFGKLKFAKANYLIKTPVEDLVGAMIGKLYPESKFGHMEFSHDMKANQIMWREFFRASWAKERKQVYTTGKSLLDLQEVARTGKVDYHEPVWGERAHKWEKYPLQKAVYEKSLYTTTKELLKQGVDMTDPTNIMLAQGKAYADGLNAILMNKNKAADGWSRALATASESVLGQGVAFVLKTQTPIVRIPANALGRILEGAFGIFLGPYADVQIRYKNAKGRNMTAKERVAAKLDVKPEDYVAMANAYKRGGPGLALIIYGYIHRDQFGGHYSKGEKKRKEGDLEHEGIRGVPLEIAKMGGHADMIALPQIGATIGHIADAAKDNPGDLSHVPPALMQTVMELVGSLPYFQLGETLTDSGSLQTKGTRTVVNTLMNAIPAIGALRDFAKYSDLGNKRDPKTWQQMAAVNLPVLRQTVPLKETSSGSRSRTRTRRR